MGGIGKWIRRTWNAALFAEGAYSLFYWLGGSSLVSAVTGVMAFLQGVPLIYIVFCAMGIFAFGLLTRSKLIEAKDAHLRHVRALYIKGVNFSNILIVPGGKMHLRPEIMLANSSDRQMFYRLSESLCVIGGRTCDQSDIIDLVHHIPPNGTVKVAAPLIKDLEYNPNNTTVLPGRLNFTASFGKEPDKLNRSFVSKGGLSVLIAAKEDDNFDTSVSYAATDVKYDPL